MNIFLQESIFEVVKKLRSKGWRVEYKFIPEDPEHANGYIVCDSDYNNIIAIISSVVRWRIKLPNRDLPKNAKACVQLCNSKKEIILKKQLKKLLTVLKENQEIKKGGK